MEGQEKKITGAPLGGAKIINNPREEARLREEAEKRIKEEELERLKSEFNSRIDLTRLSPEVYQESKNLRGSAYGNTILWSFKEERFVDFVELFERAKSHLLDQAYEFHRKRGVEVIAITDLKDASKVDGSNSMIRLSGELLYRKPAKSLDSYEGKL